jgi:cell division septation protein DedD
METSSKERLTGALLVVLALVILAPELLSGRRAAERGTPPAQDPEEGAPLQTYEARLDGSKPLPATSGDVPAPAAAEIAAVPPPVTQNQASEPAATVTAAPLPAPKQQEKSAASADSQQSLVKPDKKPAADTAGTPAPAGKWWVSLGVFASRENAQQLAGKLRAAGFAIEVSQSHSKGKELFRVRAGPASDRATASALQARLAAAGQKDLSLVPP